MLILTIYTYDKTVIINSLGISILNIQIHTKESWKQLILQQFQSSLMHHTEQFLSLFLPMYNDSLYIYVSLRFYEEDKNLA